MARTGETGDWPERSGALTGERLDHDEIQPGARAFLGERESERRIQTLIDAVLTVGTDLDLTRVLQRVVESACHLIGANYGVLLLASPEREITDMICYGIELEKAEEITQLPELRGIRARRSASNQALTIEHPADTLASAGRAGDYLAPAGLPRQHPEIEGLLGVPIAMRDETFGHIYLGSEDATKFTHEDEEALLALATAAGVAIQNARLYESKRRRQQWLEAASEIAHLLLGEVNRDQALHLVTKRLREVSGACYAALILLDPASPDTMVMEAVNGLGLDYTTGIRTHVRGLPQMAMESGQPLVTWDLPHEELHDPPAEFREPLLAIGLGMVLPLVASGETTGVLYVGWERGSPHERLAAQEVPLVEMWASHAALALRQVKAQYDQARLLVLEDRDRIAHDLHDAVIQRLFAIGTRLHTASGISARPEVRRRIEEAIDDLDQTTQEVRSAIFQLHEPRRSNSTSMQDRLLAELDTARDLIGFTPRIVVHGVMDSLPVDLHSEVLTAVRHVLTIVAKHTSVSQVEVVIGINGGFTLSVTDDGSSGGQDDERIRSARIAELKAHATRLGGNCTLHTNESGCTTIEWYTPLP